MESIVFRDEIRQKANQAAEQQVQLLLANPYWRLHEPNQRLHP